MTTDNSYIPPVSEATSKVPSISIPARRVPSPRSARQSGKMKAVAKSGEEAFQAPTSSPPGKYEYINIGSRRDELDPTYWTSALGEKAENAELTKLLKLAEMYTSRSHVLNCELYKVLEMKVDELRSVIGGNEDVEALRAKNKDL
ncbi:hypothetical protein Fot_31855 [Forsythia ovata]|uniref:Uncharacterized protein n=1 Tax=Forsythia ovata TaxID=205694 RepID=A0ABD1T6L5_9LAMI